MMPSVGSMQFRRREEISATSRNEYDHDGGEGTLNGYGGYGGYDISEESPFGDWKPPLEWSLWEEEERRYPRSPPASAVPLAFSSPPDSLVITPKRLRTRIQIRDTSIDNGFKHRLSSHLSSHLFSPTVSSPSSRSYSYSHSHESSQIGTFSQPSVTVSVTTTTSSSSSGSGSRSRSSGSTSSAGGTTLASPSNYNSQILLVDASTSRSGSNSNLASASGVSPTSPTYYLPASPLEDPNPHPQRQRYHQIRPEPLRPVVTSHLNQPRFTRKCSWSSGVWVWFSGG